MSGYDTLLRKLDEFIRKYYLNRILRGVLYTVAIVGAFFLVITTSEYFGEFSTTTRTVLFWLFVAFKHSLLWPASFYGPPPKCCA